MVHSQRSLADRNVLSCGEELLAVIKWRNEAGDRARIHWSSQWCTLTPYCGLLVTLTPELCAVFDIWLVASAVQSGPVWTVMWWRRRCRIIRRAAEFCVIWSLFIKRSLMPNTRYRNPALMLRVHARLSCMHWQSSNVESWLCCAAGSKHSDTWVKLGPTYPCHYPRKHLCLVRFAGALYYIHTHVVVGHGRCNFTARHIKGYCLGLWFIQQ